MAETMHVYEYVSFSLATIFLMCPFWWFKMKSQLIILSKALQMSEQEIWFLLCMNPAEKEHQFILLLHQ